MPSPTIAPHEHHVPAKPEPLPGGEPPNFAIPQPLTSLQLLYLRMFEGTDSPGKLSVELPRGDETILLVEDTSWLREIVARALQILGYTVLQAAHGEGAIQVAASYQGAIHLLVSDLLLPGIGGRRLAEQLGTLKPGIKSLYISGYSADAALRHSVLGPEAAFLQKPFTPKALAFQIRAVLRPINQGRRDHD